MERKFLDFSLPGNECSMERKFHRTESSLYGLFAPENESAEEQKGQIPSEQFSKYPDIIHMFIINKLLIIFIYI